MNNLLQFDQCICYYDACISFGFYSVSWIFEHCGFGYAVMIFRTTLLSVADHNVFPRLGIIPFMPWASAITVVQARITDGES